MVLLVTTIGAFMSPFDGSVVTIAIPSIASSIKLSLESVVWVPLAYLLLLTLLLINVGRLADLHGRKRFYSLGFALFTLGSILCGLSTSDIQLISFRALQGAGAAFIAANSTAIVTDVFPTEGRGRALGINTMAVYTGLTVGPVLGGVLVQAFGWRSIFFVNVPIGILVITLVTLKLRQNPPKTLGTRFDLPGAATLSVALAASLIVLTFGGIYGWFSAPTIVLGALSVGMFFLFLRIERVSPFPTLNLSLFSKNRLFAAANATAFLSYVAVIGVTLTIAIYLETIKGLSPEITGLYLIAQALPMASFSPVSGWLSDRFGSRTLSTVGMGCVTIGLFLFSGLNAQSSALDVILRLVIVGIGFGFFSSPNTSAIMGSVSQGELGVAAGTLGTMRFMGQSIGLAMLGAVMATTLSPQALLTVFTSLTSQGGVVTSEFVSGMRTFFLIATGMGALGTLASTTRGHEGTYRNRKGGVEQPANH
jgi:EmrB/QacA subfamily drug resistance transporter